MDKRISHFQKNTQMVLTSEVIARAVILAGDTSYIVSVYQMSSDLEFYWVNEAGKKPAYHKKESGPYKDFGSFLQYLASSKKGEIISSKIYSAEELAAILENPAHFSIQSDWSPFVNSANPKDYEKQSKKLQRKLRGTPLFWQ